VTRLLLLLLAIITGDVIETELVDILRGCDNSNPVSEGVLLQELFSEVLKVPLREWNVGGDSEFGVSIADNFNVVAELSSLAVDFYAIMEELLEVSTIENTV